MTNEAFNQIINNQLEWCMTTLDVKGDEYDSSTCDRLHSFKVAAELMGVTTKQALAGMMVKHTVSIYDMCNSGEEYAMETWVEKITDSINYLLLLRAMLEDNESTINMEE